MEFSGQRALVTGAGKGIGYATAKMLRERGADVVGLTRSESDRAGLEALGCTAVICDLADADATRAATSPRSRSTSSSTTPAPRSSSRSSTRRPRPSTS